MVVGSHHPLVSGLTEALVSVGRDEGGGPPRLATLPVLCIQPSVQTRSWNPSSLRREEAPSPGFKVR